MHDHDDHSPSPDGVDRRGFLRCMAWAGTGVIWGVSGGVPRAFALDAIPRDLAGAAPSLLFAQVSDSHIGFSKGANPDVTGTLQLAVDRLNALPTPPALVLHTGDITQLSKDAEFDTADQLLGGIKTGRICYVPGEHDVLGDNGQQYLRRYRAGAPNGWYAFDHSGVHFIGLVNVMDLKPGGLGNLGAEQLAWLARDLRSLKASTPVVVFAHIPLWTVYPEWGWGTDDAAQALALLKRFGSVTVLNGHIHQVMQKVEGNVQFHTAFSTAFPQPAPGTAPSPGPLTVEPGRLHQVLGVTSVTSVPGRHALAIVDQTLDGAHAMAGAMAAEHGAAPATRREGALPPGTIGIDNFQFAPKVATAKAGTAITWLNRDDVPHRVVSTDGSFAPSPVLDTGQSHTVVLKAAGEHPYFCSLHPTMTGKVIVR
ncbi:MAG: metallophosphoesterase [Gemmatimonadetes bacterium]|nr:metallophosphoesterase [Gemmatimonadota bacterium]